MTGFTFTPAASAKANGFLRRSADHLAGLTPAGRHVWLKTWCVAVRDFPVGADLDAYAKAHVIATLERWRDEINEMATEEEE